MNREEPDLTAGSGAALEQMWEQTEDGSARAATSQSVSVFLMHTYKHTHSKVTVCLGSKDRSKVRRCTRTRSEVEIQAYTHLLAHTMKSH